MGSPSTLYFRHLMVSLVTSCAKRLMVGGTDAREGFLPPFAAFFALWGPNMYHLPKSVLLLNPQGRVTLFFRGGELSSFLRRLHIYMSPPIIYLFSSTIAAVRCISSMGGLIILFGGYIWAGVYICIPTYHYYFLLCLWVGVLLL